MAATITPTHRSGSRRVLVAALASLVTLASCGVSGGNDTTATTGSTTTTKPDDDPVSADALRALLPTVAEVGPEYEVAEKDDPEEDDDQQFEAAVRTACPNAAAFLDDASSSDDDDIAREFETPDDRTISVTLNPDPRNLGEDELDRLIGVINGCDTIDIEDEDEISASLDLEAERDDTYGDRGMVMQMHVAFGSGLLPEPIELDARIRVFTVGPVSVSINAGDGIDETTLATIPGDVDIIDTLAADLQTKVEDLVG